MDVEDMMTDSRLICSGKDRNATGRDGSGPFFTSNRRATTIKGWTVGHESASDFGPPSDVTTDSLSLSLSLSVSVCLSVSLCLCEDGLQNDDNMRQEEPQNSDGIGVESLFSGNLQHL